MVKITVVVFQNMTPSNLVGGFQCCIEIYCLHIQGRRLLSLRWNQYLLLPSITSVLYEFMDEKSSVLLG
jgi:hypothetical protein